VKCRIRHRYSRWSMVRIEMRGGGGVSVVPYCLFRMCRICGHEQHRDLRVRMDTYPATSALSRWRARMP
jgi:hypothetical protein